MPDRVLRVADFDVDKVPQGGLSVVLPKFISPRRFGREIMRRQIIRVCRQDGIDLLERRWLKNTVPQQARLPHALHRPTERHMRRHQSKG